jgi:hypothetical protein
MFKTSHIPTMFADRSRAQALETWREAASLVRLRWRAFLEADAVCRPQAFAAYVAALDTEEAAAAEIALLSDIAA